MTRPRCTAYPQLNWHSLEPDEQEACKAICGGCDLRVECHAGAIERNEPWGVWGGELFPLVDMAEPAWELPAIEPTHNRARYVSGCRCDVCTDANRRFVASWRLTHVPVEPKPDVAPQLMFAF